VSCNTELVALAAEIGTNPLTADPVCESHMALVPKLVANVATMALKTWAAVCDPVGAATKSLLQT